MDSDDLRVGDVLLLKDGSRATIVDVSFDETCELVYNFTVDELHNYCIGEHGTLVHNSCESYKVRKSVRQQAVAKAWKNEADLVRNTGKGTRKWTVPQKKQLLSKGKVKGFVGHHINSVNASPLFAGSADNIRFLTRLDHYRAHNNGRFRIPTFGDFIER